MGSQFGFAEALVNPNAGKNRRLDAIDRLVDWAALERFLPGSRPASSPGRRGYPALPMLKAILLAQWYQLSDPALEEALSDRLSFRRFCGFALDDPTPDETTLCRFRNELAEKDTDLVRLLAERSSLIREVAKYKADTGLPSFDREREGGGREGQIAPPLRPPCRNRCSCVPP